jgi:hypothetical protein
LLQSCDAIIEKAKNVTIVVFSACPQRFYGVPWVFQILIKYVHLLSYHGPKESSKPLEDADRGVWPA